MHLTRKRATEPQEARAGQQSFGAADEESIARHAAMPGLLVRLNTLDRMMEAVCRDVLSLIRTQASERADPWTLPLLCAPHFESMHACACTVCLCTLKLMRMYRKLRRSTPSP
jgi:hypothetical protein